MQTYLSEFWTDTRGQDLVEYALMAGMVAIAAVAAIPQLSAGYKVVVTKIGSIITASMP
ncbi:MAG TPA: Flp family type IVb pilin [Bryobacteraceae bacterium]|jgi:pilus assembly protein Flp/PilA